MAMEQEVQVIHEDKKSHLFVVRIDSFLEQHRVGETITCGKCKRTGRITHVGIPARLPSEGHSHDEGQENMLR